MLSVEPSRADPAGRLCFRFRSTAARWQARVDRATSQSYDDSDDEELIVAAPSDWLAADDAGLIWSV